MPEYRPASQSAQATVALDDACPAAQAVHFVAPGAVSASVIEPPSHSSQLMACVPGYNPATQSTQAVVDSAEAWPAAHAVHLVPPTDASVSVTEPPAHTAHADSDTDPVAPTNFPTAHPMQAPDALDPADATYRPAAQFVHACVDAAENFPASHAVHVLPPLAASASVLEPATHAVHATVEAAEK